MIAQREAPAGDTVTVIVTGLARSGTSVVAGILNELGAPMGESWARGVFEDAELDADFKYWPFEVPHHRIEARNANPIWGFKHPALYDRLRPEDIRHFRNPRLVVVTRDFAAVCARYLRDNPNLDEIIPETSEQHSRMIKFFQAADCPKMMVSYERFLASPLQLILPLAEFCGLKYNAAALTRALALVGDKTDYEAAFGTQTLAGAALGAE
jgi:hypothetical protein